MLKVILKFFAADVVAKGAAVLAIPFFSLLLGPAELGEFSEWFSFFNVAVALVSIGVPSYVLVLLSRDAGNADVVIQRSLRFLMESILAFGVLACVCSFFEFDFFLTAGIFFASAVFVLLTFLGSVLRHKKCISEYFKLQIFMALSASLVPLIFVYFDPSWQSRVVGYLVGLAAVFLLVFWLCRHKVRLGTIDGRFRVDSLCYGSSIVAMTMVAWFKLGGDVQYLKAYSGYESSGVLFFSFQIVSVVSIVAASLNRSSSPTFYRLLHEGLLADFRILVVRLSGILFILTLTVLFSSFLLVRYFLQEFSDSALLLLPMSVGALLYGVGQFLAAVFLYNKRPHLLTLCVVVSSLLHPLLSYLLITYFDWRAIGWSYLMSSLVFLILVSMTLRYSKVSHS